MTSKKICILQQLYTEFCNCCMHFFTSPDVSSEFIFLSLQIVKCKENNIVRSYFLGMKYVMMSVQLLNFVSIKKMKAFLFE